MDPRDLEMLIARYTSRLDQFGHDPKTLGWGKSGRQHVRFSVVAELILKQKHGSVLDVGCGFADLHDYLRSRGWEGKYTGVDLVPRLADVARERHPEIDIRIADFSSVEAFEDFDFVVACGIMNARLQHTDNSRYIENMLFRMWEHTRQAMSCDFMTTQVDYEAPGGWHTEPSWALTTFLKLTRRVVFRADYMPYEYTLWATRDIETTSENVFKSRPTL